MFGLLKKIFTIDNSQLKEAIKEGSYLVDVRTPNEYASGSVKGAVNIPLNKLHVQLTKLKEKKNIVVFCKSGIRSRQAKTLLQQNGFTNVINGGTWMNVDNIVKATQQ